MSDDRKRFEDALKYASNCLTHWTGATLLDVEDRDITGGRIHPDGGDWVAYDARGRSGVWGMPHDALLDVRKVKLRNATAHGLNLRLKKIPRAVCTSELMRRYVWISDMTLNWLHRDDGTPFIIWKTVEEIDAAYEAARPTFEDDPHLALYWLVHFGFCADPRYDDVAAAIREHGHDQTLEQIRWALAFFDETGLDHEIDLTPGYNPKGADYRGLFLRRRANLLHMVHSFRLNGKGQRPDLIWNAISLYRAGDPWAIRRMRWFVRNMDAFDLWEEMAGKLDDPASDDIPFISYPRAFQPGRADCIARADATVAALLATKEDWHFFSARFGKIILYDLREIVGDKAAYKDLVDQIYEGDIASDQYSAICMALGEAPPASEENRAALAAFNALFEGQRGITLLPQEDADMFLARTDAALAGMGADTLTFVAQSVSAPDAVKAVARYLVMHLDESQIALTASIFGRARFWSSAKTMFFGGSYPQLVASADDPLFKALMLVMTKPESSFSAEHVRDNALEAACNYLGHAMHLPDIFEPVMDLFETSEDTLFKDAVCEHLFVQSSRHGYNVPRALDAAQTTRVQEALLAYLLAHPEITHARAAYRAMGAMNTAHGRPWTQALIKDKSRLAPLEAYEHYSRTLADEVREELTWSLDD